MSYEKLVKNIPLVPRHSSNDLEGGIEKEAYILGHKNAVKTATGIAADADSCIADLNKEIDLLKEKLKMATNALAMIAKYAPTRPAAELGLAPEADASWARQAGSMAKSTLEEIAKKDSEANNE